MDYSSPSYPHHKGIALFIISREHENERKKQKQKIEKEITQKGCGEMNKGRRDMLVVLEGKERTHGHDREMRFN